MPHNDVKHRAKRWNERVKLAATLLNSMAIVTLAAAFINPIANKHYDVLSDGGLDVAFGRRRITYLGADCADILPRRGVSAMPYGYALQILAVIVVFGAVAIAALAIGARRFDRETKAAEERASRQ